MKRIEKLDASALAMIEGILDDIVLTEEMRKAYWDYCIEEANKFLDSISEDRSEDAHTDLTAPLYDTRKTRYAIFETYLTYSEERVNITEQRLVLKYMACYLASLDCTMRIGDEEHVLYPIRDILNLITTEEETRSVLMPFFDESFVTLNSLRSMLQVKHDEKVLYEGLDKLADILVEELLTPEQLSLVQ